MTAEERKNIKPAEKEDLYEMMELLRELPEEDRREVRGVILGLKMAQSA